jgi:CheY-like chemotaxis protein
VRNITKPIKPSQFYAALNSLAENLDNSTNATPQNDFAFDARESIQSILEKQEIRILMAEDNLINQRVLKSILSKVNLEVEIVNDGQEAVEAIEKQNYDMVLMDIQMPRMDGLTATEHIRETMKLHELPIIALTAHAMKGDKDKCIAVGMNDYLSKPIDPDELLRTLLKWLVRETIPAE